MKDTANANCRELLDVMIAQGVETIILSPGSRNTPLLIGASARESLKKYIIHDERTAAFTALGIAMISKKPVALACTSGTALYNYAPAIAEAYYQNIPLIIITADRPAQWIDQDDSQTLRQFGALDKIVKRSYDIYAETGMSIPCRNKDYASEREWYVNRIANEAVLTAISGKPGPVHINMQFADPLNVTIDYKEQNSRIISIITNDNALAPHKCREIAEELLEKRVMVVSGFMPSDNALNRAISEFCQLPNVTLMAETISNLHVRDHSHMIDAVLSKIDSQTKENLRPDIVISIGGSLVSRMLKEYIRECRATEHWTLSDTDVSIDCFQRLSKHLDVSPTRFFSSISGMSRHLLKKGFKCKHTNYNSAWKSIRDKIYTADKTNLSKLSWSEMKAFSKVFNEMPTDWNLFLSNGTSVRYAQLLIDRNPHGCYCNRGVSGIDGTNATAFGASLAYGGTTLLVTGDMSFAYCPEILNLRKLGGDLRIIVINNHGGGIFRFIRTTRELEIREEYFCCDPQHPTEAITKAYGWNYLQANNESELAEALDKLICTPTSLLEINVPPEKSAETLIQRLENR